MGVLFLIIFLIVTVVAIRLACDGMDRTRIQRYVAARGGCNVRIVWSPFGTGWMGDNKSRIYEVSYSDASGRRRSSTCKTSSLGGVYWTEDVACPRASFGFRGRKSQAALLREENRRLKEELRRLKEHDGPSDAPHLS